MFYHKYTDEQNFVDYCLIEESNLNADAYDRSRYFYKIDILLFVPIS
jgi:hypothetical protein